tara:strand:- start:261 stop:620 length:360 start_codon:yes stop_codon:yes gene_type:complete
MYTLTVKPFLDQYNKKYIKIITINQMPTGNLAQYVKRIQTPKLSPFKQDDSCCSRKCCENALYKFDDTSKFMCIDEIPDLFTYLATNNYTINYELTKMMNDGEVKITDKILCFFSYNEN